MSILRRVRVKKVFDAVFNNDHPNKINEGYEKEGFIYEIPKVGDALWLWPNKMQKMGDHYSAFHTSYIKEFLPGKIITRNSVYEVQLESYTEDGTVNWIDFDVNFLLNGAEEGNK